MSTPAAKSESKTPETNSHRRKASETTKPASADAQSILLCLQRRGGNRSVGRLLDAVSGKLPSEQGRLLDDATRSEMEKRFGEDFSQVRVHSEGAAAATAHDALAQAYTSGQHIIFAPGRYDMAGPGGRGLLAHELAHVVQQRRGGAKPPLDAGGPHEQGAHAAAAAFTGGSGPVSVDGASGIGMARSADEWLSGTMDLTNWRYSDLVAERDELQQWMDRQLATDDRVLKIEEAIELINASIRQLEQGVRGPQKARRKGGKRDQKAGAENGASVSEPQQDLEPPHCLVQQSTVAFQDPEDMRQEFDRIVAWLQRKNVPPPERRILQEELDYLAPLLGQTLKQRSQEKRRARISSALKPGGGGSARASIREAVRLVEGIKPVAGHEDQYYLMHGEEMFALTKEEAVSIRASAVSAMSDAIKKVQALDNDSITKLQGQLEVDVANRFAAWGTSLFTDMDTSDAVNRYLPLSKAVRNAVSEFLAAKRSGNLTAMAEQLADAEEIALKGSALVNGHIDDIQTTGEKIITGLQITQAAAFTIVMVATAGAAAPMVGAGVAGAGFTGVAATAVTATGTASIIGVEGFALGGSSSTVGQLATGKSLSESAAEGWKEGKKWGETGVKIGASVVLAPASAARFGASREGIGVVNQVLRSGAAVGTTNLGVEAGSRALFHQDTLSLGEAATTFGGGFLGGMGGPLTGKLSSPMLRGAANVAWGAGTSGGLTYLETGDADKAWQGAALGGASSLSLGEPPQPGQQALTRAYRGGQKLRSAATSVKRSAGNTLKATMLGVKLSGAAPDISAEVSPGMWNRPVPGLPAPASPASKTNFPSEQNTVKPTQPDAAEALSATSKATPSDPALAEWGKHRAPGDRNKTKAQWRAEERERRIDASIDRAFNKLENGDKSNGVGVPEATGGASNPRIDGRAVPGPRELPGGEAPMVKPDGTTEDPRGRILDMQHIPRRNGETGRQAVARVRSLIGRKLSDFPALESLWNDARQSVLSREALTQDNYGKLYDRTRNAFWRRVRSNTPEGAQTRALLETAGFDLPKGKTRAARLVGEGEVFKEDLTMSLDHIEEKGQRQGWQKALDADNLAMEFAGPNSEREIKQMRHPSLRGSN